jgi:outer membrane protein assembly factor BamA
MNRFTVILIFLIPAYFVNAQPDSRERNKPIADSSLGMLAANPTKLDSMDLTVKDIIITGNKVTKDEIIRREMHIKIGSKLSSEDYKADLQRIYNLGLFNRVDILPIPVSDKFAVVEVVVQEKWYIFPMPTAGLDEGEWSKLWLGMYIRWANFRGRDESISAFLRILYNPSFRVSYRVPWIGDKLHLFSSVSAGYSKFMNQSLQALGIANGTRTYTVNDTNFEYTHFNSELMIGKFLTERFNVYTNVGYNYLRVSDYKAGRTLSPTGKDKYIGIGLGIEFDSRNIREYATKGFFLNSSYTRYGLIDRAINFSRYSIESESFIPISLTKDYYVTIASKLNTNVAIGPVIPIYNHEMLGYSGNYVRGWRGLAYEGENIFTIYNELRIPILQPAYTKASQLPIVKSVPYIKNMDLKYGLYFTLIYDVGTVWYNDERIYNKRFLSGTGIGLDALLPFGYLLRTEWVMRVDDPLKGEFTVSLGVKF